MAAALTPGPLELLGQPVGAVLGTDEQQRPSRAGDDLRGDGELVVGADGEDVVVHGVHGGLDHA